MLRITCNDIGIAGCDFVAEGKKVRKVENTMLEHLRDEHPGMISGLTDVGHQTLVARIESGMCEIETRDLETEQHVS